MDFDNSIQVDALSKLPPEPATAPPKWNGWSAPLRGLAAGVAEAGAFVADSLKGYGQTMGATGTQSAGGMFSLPNEKERRDAELQRAQNAAQGPDTTSNVGTSLRNVSRDYRPDPATAGLAERLMFDLPRFMGKAVGYTVVGGGVPGAVMLAGDEAMTTADDLAQQGVDKDIRMQVGAVAGLAAGAGVLLPVAAPGSLAKTAGLWAVGGPGAFIAQQQASRAILADANYASLAEQYDPLDPVGLAVSSLIPAAFGAHAVIKARGAIDKSPIQQGLTPDQVDAVMTHNLTVAQDVRDSTPSAEAVRLVTGVRPPDAADPHLARLPEAPRKQLLQAYQKAAEVKPDFDATLDSIARAFGGEVKASALKGTERAVDKVLGDYAGDASRIKDLVRGTIIVKSLDNVEQAIVALRGKFEVLPSGFRDGLTGEAMDATGYRDVKMNVRIDGHVAEVQVSVPEMLAAKKQAHALYKELAALIRKVEGDGREQTAAERDRANALRAQQNEIYATAWKEVTSARKAASETTAPLRNADSAGNTRGDGSHAVAEAPSSTTGTPSTSSKAEPGGKAAGSSEGSVMSMDSILPDKGVFGESSQGVDMAAYQRSLDGRVAAVELMAPDMVVGIDDTGKAITVKQEMERIRREAVEGTEDTLGAQDAPLLEIAAGCALTTGAA